MDMQITAMTNEVRIAIVLLTESEVSARKELLTFSTAVRRKDLTAVVTSDVEALFLRRRTGSDTELDFMGCHSNSC